MITAAQRAAPLVKTNSMLGPTSPARSPHRRGSAYAHDASNHDFQDGLLGRPSPNPHSLKKKTTSLLNRRTGSMQKNEPVYIKEGYIKKLTSHHKWVDKSMALSEETLTISDADNRTDYIPLHEITNVDLSQLKQSMSSLRRNTPQELEEAAAMESSAMSFLKSKLKGPATSSATAGDSGKLQTRHAFDVFTTHEGRNSGRTYTFMAASEEECEEWMTLLLEKSKQRAKLMRKLSRLEEWREWARNLYNSWMIQGMVSFLIFANFGVNAFQAEFHPATMSAGANVPEAKLYLLIDIVLTVIFLFELVFNAFGHWLVPFLSDAWNYFDALIVCVSLISILVPAVPGLTLLRVLRAFRLLRLIRKLRSLKRIFDALIWSIIPVLNAFFIGVLITCIYTIVGVFLFADVAPEHFGTFNRSLYTLFMLIATGDWPSDAVPAFGEDDGKLNLVTFAYLFSFVATVLWTCIQVVVAVLLDNFLSVTQEEKRQEAIALELARSKTHVLDPLLQKLLDSAETDTDLHSDILAVFEILDVDNSGEVNNQEMVEGFGKLELKPRIRLSADDCKALKDHSLGPMDDDEELDSAAFERLMRVQLHAFVQRKMHDAFVNQEDPSGGGGGGGGGGQGGKAEGEGEERLARLELAVTNITEQQANMADKMEAMHRTLTLGLARLAPPDTARDDNLNPHSQASMGAGAAGGPRGTEGAVRDAMSSPLGMALAGLRHLQNPPPAPPPLGEPDQDQDSASASEAAPSGNLNAGGLDFGDFGIGSTLDGLGFQIWGPGPEPNLNHPVQPPPAAGSQAEAATRPGGAVAQPVPNGEPRNPVIGDTTGGGCGKKEGVSSVERGGGGAEGSNLKDVEGMRWAGSGPLAASVAPGRRAAAIVVASPGDGAGRRRVVNGAVVNADFVRGPERGGGRNLKERELGGVDAAEA